MTVVLEGVVYGRKSRRPSVLRERWWLWWQQWRRKRTEAKTSVEKREMETVREMSFTGGCGEWDNDGMT